MPIDKLPLSRRRFLGLGAALSAAAIPGLVSKSQSVRAQDSKRVLVIGAGVAGLAAGLWLHQSGHSVTILEGRDRVGGRVWTDRSLRNLPLDMGASWIQGIDGNPLFDFVQEYGIRVVPSDPDNITLYAADGERIDDPTALELEDAFDELMSEIDAYRETLDSDIALGTAIQHVLNEWDLSDEERHALRAMVNITIEHEYAADVDDLSLWWWDSDDGFGGGDVLFPNGYDQVIQQLADGLDIRLNQIVQSVEYGEDGVTVTTAQGSFAGDYAVITLPLGILKSGSVSFSPPLPAAKRAAIRKLGMSVLNKVYLHFPEVFWDSDAEWIGYLGEHTGEWAAALNLYAYTQQPVLLLFNAAEYGLAIEAMSDEQIVEKAMEMLRVLYGENIPDPDGVLITRWGQDPFALGSYSSIYLGAAPEDREALAESVENVLFFAGEATSIEYAATVHGALLSGRRAAEEIMESAH
jgi:monoamine oxidase